MPVVTSPTFSCVVLAQKENPVQRRNKPRNGNVKSNRLRRPQRSMVNSAGMANNQFKIPVPIEANRAEFIEYPDWVKMVVL